MFALFRNVFSAKGWINKLSFILKGPGWTPGKPRLGDPEDVPLVSIWLKKLIIYIRNFCS
jgi:hypothetical protein